ncbi:integrin alpha-PS3-like, partial [Asbolus verrucosus]
MFDIDIAVAAPYEDEKSGVLYVYRGNGNGLDINYCQRIAGKDIYPNIRGFGISMSRTVDIDSNKYPDVAVGAYLSGHVVLLRTRPTIKIFHNLNSLSPHLDHNEKSFQISACFWFDLNQNVSVNIRRIISVDQQLGRAKLKNSKHKEIIQLSPNQANCQNITISIDNSHSNKVDPITVSLAHEFIAENKPKEVVYVSQDIVGTDGFCETCAVYDKDKSSSLTTVEVPFILGCGSDNICTASLDFEATFTDIGDDNIFVLGSKNYVTLQTVVKNAGEKAYLTQVLVTLPDLINFRSIPSACMEQNTSSVLCSVDNPLESNSQKTTTLDLDMTDVNDGKNDEPLIITVMVLTSSQNIKNNVKYITLKLRREADVTISGKSDEQSYPFRNMAGTPNLFSQTYQVEKSGRSRLNEIQIEIDIPHKFKTKKNTLIDFISLYAPSGNIIAQEIICTSNFNYILESKKDTEGVIDSLTENDDFDQKQPSKRSKRQIEVFNKTTNDVTERLTAGNEFDKLQNRTFYINCSVPEVICSKVICTSGSVKSNQIASIQLKMLLNVSVVKEFLGKKDIIQFATHGSVIVKNPLNFIQSGNKPDNADVTSLFVGDGVEEEVALWIIVVSIIAGLLLLLLIVLGLIK